MSEPDNLQLAELESDAGSRRRQRGRRTPSDLEAVYDIPVTVSRRARQAPPCRSASS